MSEDEKLDWEKLKTNHCPRCHKKLIRSKVNKQIFYCPGNNCSFSIWEKSIKEMMACFGDAEKTRDYFRKRSGRLEHVRKKVRAAEEQMQKQNENRVALLRDSYAKFKQKKHHEKI